jgi:polyhydroxyalkanoate synthesis regulator phasin
MSGLQSFNCKFLILANPQPIRYSMENNNLLKQLLMIGIGTTSLVAEKVQEITDQWVKEGRINPEQGTKFVEEMMQQLKLDQTNLEEIMQRQIRNMMQDIGVPRQSELDELRGRLDRMERQLRDLENRLWR